MGRRKRSRHPHESTGGTCTNQQNAVLSTNFSMPARRELGAAKRARRAGSGAPRPAQEPPESRQTRPREAARAIQDGPGAVQEEPGAARSRPGSAKTAPEPPKSRQDRPKSPTQRLQGRSRRRREGLPGSVSAPANFRQRLWYLWTVFGSPRGSSGTEKLHRRDHGVVRAQAEPNDWPAPSHDRISSTI